MRHKVNRGFKAKYAFKVPVDHFTAILLPAKQEPRWEDIVLLLYPGESKWSPAPSGHVPPARGRQNPRPVRSRGCAHAGATRCVTSGMLFL